MLSWDHTFSASSAVSTSLYERLASARLVPTSDPLSIQAGGLRNDITIGAKSDYSLYIGSAHSIKTGIDLMLLRLREDLAFDRRENEIEIEPFDLRRTRDRKNSQPLFSRSDSAFRNSHRNLGLRYDQYGTVLSGHALVLESIAYALPGANTVLHFAYNRFFRRHRLKTSCCRPGSGSRKDSSDCAATTLRPG
jgi:hypothetical protein